MNPRDTSQAAHELQQIIFRRMTGSERVALAIQMSEEARSLARDGLRHRQHDASDAEIDQALRRLMLGAPLADVIDHP